MTSRDCSKVGDVMPELREVVPELGECSYELGGSSHKIRGVSFELGENLSQIYRKRSVKVASYKDKPNKVRTHLNEGCNYTKNLV